MTLHEGLAHHGISPLGIKALDTFGVGFGNDAHGVVANHRLRFFAPQRPDGEKTLVLTLRNHRVDKSPHLLGRHQRVERMCRAIGVPERKSGIHLRAVHCLGLLATGVAIAAIDVGDVVGLDEGVVERGVEHLHLFLRAGDVDAGEVLFPSRIGRFGRLVKLLPAGEFGRQIAPSARHAVGRERHLHLQHPGVGKVHQQAAAFESGDGIERGETRHRLRKTNDKIDVLVHPNLAADVSRQRLSIVPDKLTLLDALTIALPRPGGAVLQVDVDRAARTGLKRVSIVGHVGRGGGFRAHPGIEKLHGVVARARCLRALATAEEVHLVVALRHARRVGDLGILP